MPDDCAAILKQYAAMWGITQQEVLYQSSKCFIHTQAAHGCQGSQRILDTNNTPIDKRAGKPCYGSCCFCCEHIGRCRIGTHKGEWECSDRYKHLLTPDNQSIQLDPL